MANISIRFKLTHINYAIVFWKDNKLSFNCILVLYYITNLSLQKLMLHKTEHRLGQTNVPNAG